MNVVHYSPYPLARDTGTGNIMLGWCEALARQGEHVTLLVDGRLTSRPCPPSIHCVPVKHVLQRRLTVPVPADMRRHLRGADLLVVHGGFVPWNIVAGRAATAVGVPYLVMPQGVYNERLIERRWAKKRIWNILLERRHLRRAFGIHLHHESELGGLRRLGVSLPAVITPNGISVPERIRWDGGSGGYLLYLGRYDVSVKGLDILVRSFTHLPEDARPSLRLHGTDHEGGKAIIAGLVRELGLERWITVGDPIYEDEKWDAVTRAAGSVYPSRTDAWPMSVSESVGAGVPTLVADYPLGRLLADEGAAVLAERSPEGVAAAIRRLRSEEGREVARRGRALAEGRLSWDVVARSWLEQVARLREGALARGQ